MFLVISENVGDILQVCVSLKNAMLFSTLFLVIMDLTRNPPFPMSHLSCLNKC